MTEEMHPGIDRLHDLVVELKEVAALQAVADLLEAGVEPDRIMLCFHRALARIGRLFQAREYYMASLVLAGELMLEAMSLILPRLVAKGDSREVRGRVVTATIEGDIHDLGKSLAEFLLTANDFEVIDLGVDVPPRVILAETLRQDPVAVGVSLLFTACVPAAKRLASFQGDLRRRARSAHPLGRLRHGRHRGSPLGPQGVAWRGRRRRGGL